ncbi:heme anaerobic degradation radical SAM methyltransferase ChuW/HutW, partial [Klebsiella pneumoniae]|nr:heme anaerobic degradation radical SAM methyltransferase ChuW/HutW [Klebsiella pneumoniae]
GTPSALSARDLARIITALRDKLPLAPDCEITIEGRVLNFDDARIDACLDAGANRFSIGIQSFNSRIRKKMARTSDGPTAMAFMQGLVKRDRAAVVCDLLF